MATFDYPSDLVHRIPYPTIQRPGLRIDLRVAALPAEEGNHAPIAPSRQGLEEGSLFREIESGANLGRNPLAGAGALALQCLLLLTLIVIPLFRTGPLPKRETLTTLYLQPPSAAGSNATKLQAPKLASTYVPTSTGISAPVNKTQEAPPPPVSTTGGVLGGVPGGMVGAVPGGAFSEILNSAPNVPALAK